VLHVSRDSRGSDLRKGLRYDSRHGYVKDKDGKNITMLSDRVLSCRDDVQYCLVYSSS